MLQKQSEALASLCCSIHLLHLLLVPFEWEAATRSRSDAACSILSMWKGQYFTSFVFYLFRSKEKAQSWRRENIHFWKEEKWRGSFYAFGHLTTKKICRGSWAWKAISPWFSEFLFLFIPPLFSAGRGRRKRGLRILTDQSIEKRGKTSKCVGNNFQFSVLIGNFSWETPPLYPLPFPVMYSAGDHGVSAWAGWKRPR